MFYFLIDLVPLNSTVVVIKEDNEPTTCVVVEKAANHRFSSDKFGEVNKPTKEIICN